MALSASTHLTNIGSDGWPAHPAPDDAHLITRSQDGDVQAFNLRVAHYQQHVYAVCFRTLRDADAEDVTQEVVLAAFRGLRRYHGGSFIAWLLRIATNKSLDGLCAPKLGRFLSLDVGAGADAVPVELREGGEGPDERVLRAELTHILKSTLGELPTDQRLVVIVSDIQGYSYEEIGAAMGWPTGTVKSRLSRAGLRDALRSGELRAMSTIMYVQVLESGGQHPGSIVSACNALHYQWVAGVGTKGRAR